MRRGIRFLLVVCFGVILSLRILTEVYAEERRLIKVGDPLPEIPLQAPDRAEDAAYLGIPEGKSFTIKDVNADLVFVEILERLSKTCSVLNH